MAEYRSKKIDHVEYDWMLTDPYSKMTRVLTLIQEHI